MMPGTPIAWRRPSFADENVAAIEIAQIDDKIAIGHEKRIRAYYALRALVDLVRAAKAGEYDDLIAEDAAARTAEYLAAKAERFGGAS